jgi:branched-chain amino acid transport system permease protein
MQNPQLWVSVFTIGSFYGLIALSFYLTLVGAQFFNFAIGTYAMIAGLGTSWLVIFQSWPLWLAALTGLLAAVALSVLTEVAVIRPVQKRSNGELPALVAVAAVLFAVQQGAGLLFGHQALPGQPIFATDRITIGDAVIQPSAVPLFVATIAVFAATWLWIRGSRTGRLLRAVGDSNEAARTLGLPVGRVRIIAFAVGGLIAGVAGLVFAPSSGIGVGPDSGLHWTLSGFLAFVIGGSASVWAPLVGGMLLAMLQIFVSYYFGGDVAVYGILLVALVFFAFRPEGLFARRVRV